MRFFSPSQIEANPTRVAEGWERRFIASGARAEEMMKLYEELGYEVLAEDIRGEQIRGECEDCQVAILLQFKMIYTRARGAPSAPATR